MQQRGPADAAYLTIDGHAEVILENAQRAGDSRNRRRQEIVGEEGILGNAPRAWTVRAKEIGLSDCTSQRSRLCASWGESPIIAVSTMPGLAQRLGRRNGNCCELEQRNNSASTQVCPVSARHGFSHPTG